MAATPTIGDIIHAIEQVADPSWQESYDNTGPQVVPDLSQLCTGVMICVDATPGILEEAQRKECNLVLSHHPLMFRALKSFTSRNRVDCVAMQAIRNGISIYSCHTAIDNAYEVGISFEMARRLGLTDIRSLTAPEGCPGSGAIGNLANPLTPLEFVNLVKRTFHSPVARCSAVPQNLSISRVGLCGGAGSDFIQQAIAQGAQVYLTSDCKLNFFLDDAESIFLVDIGHFESEECVKDIFYQIITEKFPNFAVYKSATEKNPVNYL